MQTKFRIGYPYATSEIFKECVVILTPTPYFGFTSVLFGNKKYALPPTDPGPNILSDVRQKGLVGELIELNDPKKISIAQRNQIDGQGISMQLALVLAIFASYESKEQQDKLPILLFSGAVDHPNCSSLQS